MAESRIKDENFYQIQGWMINRLGLKGVPLSVYAIIYGFSQDGENEYKGSLQYLCDFLGGVSKPTVINALKSLVELKYIHRREEIINGVQFNRYKVNLPLLKNLYYGSQETLPEAVKKLEGGSKETLPKKEEDNKSSNSEKKNIKGIPASFLKLISDYAKGNSEVEELLLEWLKIRQAKRAATTDKAIELNLKKLDRLAKESKMTVPNYLDEIIRRGWQAFYVINTYGNEGKTVGANGIAVDHTAPDDLAGIF